jgi:hypothetical protein
MLWWDLEDAASIADGVELIYTSVRSSVVEDTVVGWMYTELTAAVSTTTAGTRCAILARYVNALQAPSRRHPQSAMRPTRVIAEERCAPMHVWEGIDVSCVVFLLHGSLLTRRVSSIVYFLVFR